MVLPLESVDPADPLAPADDPPDAPPEPCAKACEPITRKTLNASQTTFIVASVSSLKPTTNAPAVGPNQAIAIWFLQGRDSDFDGQSTRLAFSNLVTPEERLKVSPVVRIQKEIQMSIEGKAKEAAGFVKEELNEHGKSPESQKKAQEGRDLRNEGRIEDGKEPKTTKPGTGH